MELVDNSMNYGVLGHTGFTALAGVVDRSACHVLDYSDLPSALDALETIADASSC